MNILKSPTGTVIKDPKGYNVFIPNPLAPDIIWDNGLISTLSRADFILGKLAHEGSKLPNPHLLMRSFVAREAVLSSKIEGTHTTLDEIFVQDAGVPIKQDPDDVKEVQNYIDALDFGLNRLQEVPLSLRLIKEIHKCLMEGVRGAHATPGKFRTVQNWIGSPGSTVHTAKFVPPSPTNLMNCLADFEKFLHNRQLPPLVHIALCHYQFEAIHPFLDGNGRIGRLLIILSLIEQKILSAPFMYLSAFFEATRSEYYRQLLSVSTHGTWSDWLLYFLNGIAVQSEDALSRAERINDLLQTWKLQVASAASQVAVDIIECFAANPYLTVNKIADDLKIAYSTAQRGINKLETEGIISQVGDSRRDRLYCATKILAILEEPAKISVDAS